MRTYLKQGLYMQALSDAKNTEIMIRDFFEQKEISTVQAERFKNFVGLYKLNLSCLKADAITNFLYIACIDIPQTHQANPNVKKYERNQAFLKMTFQQLVATSAHVQEFYKIVPEVIDLLYVNNKEVEEKELAEQNKKYAESLISEMPEYNTEVKLFIEDYDKQGARYVGKYKKTDLESQN